MLPRIKANTNSTRHLCVCMRQEKIQTIFNLQKFIQQAELLQQNDGGVASSSFFEA